MKRTFTYIILLILVVSCQPRELKMEDTSMEATIMKGDEIKLIPAKEIMRNQVIAFTYDDQYMGEKTAILRVIGVPGDTIKIVQGQVFVNGNVFNEPPGLKHSYQAVLEGNLNEDDIRDLEYVKINDREYLFYLTRAEADRLRFNPSIKILRILVRDAGIYQEGIFGSDKVNNWNIDNYGPIKVPLPGEYGATQKEYFVMGDNRHNCVDSRYIGYILESNILGRVQYK